MNTQYDLADTLRDWIKTYSATDTNAMRKIKDARVSYATDIDRLTHGSPICTVFIDAESGGQTKPDRKPYKYDFVVAFYFLLGGDSENAVKHLCDTVDRFRDYIIDHPLMFLSTTHGVANKNIYLTLWTAISPIGTKPRESTSNLNYVYRTISVSMF